MYIHTLPTTGAVSFSDFLITSDLISQVSQATELRARLRSVLKENRAGENQSDDGSADWLRIVKAVDDYLPYLFAIFNCLQTDDLILRYEPQFSWRTTLSSSFLRSPPRIALPGIHYEMCSSLLLSGVALCNFAAAAASSLGDYERDRRLSDVQRKANDDKLRWAADTLCTACGIFEHLSQVLIPQWEAQVGRIDGRPPDVTREITLALSKLALAEAQTLAIRKLLSPSLSLAADTITPGPPLPKSHPSPSLLAKLHLNVASHFESALSLAKTVGKKTAVNSRSSEFGSHAYAPTSVPSDELSDGRSPSTREGGSKKAMFGRFKSLASREGSGSSKNAAASFGLDTAADADLDIGGSLLRYLSASANLHRALSYKWLGVDAGESGGKIGEAIAFLRMAREGLEVGAAGGSDGGKLAALRQRSASAREASDEMKATCTAELSTVDHWLKSYGKVNDTVSFQPIPRPSDLQNKIPAGRAALNSKPYRMPVPAFGPGSPGFQSEGMKRAMLADYGGSSSSSSSDGAAATEAGQLADPLAGATDAQRSTLDHGSADPDRLGFNGLSIGKARDGTQYAGSGAYY